MEVSGRKVEILCEPCSDNGQKLSAVGFCVDCCEFLCMTCYEHHCRARPFRNHVLQDKESMPKEKPGSDKTQLINNGDKCLKHQGEIIRFYCHSDCQFGCGSCMTFNHRRCDNIISIEEEYAKFDKNMKDFGLQLNKNSQTKDQNIIEIEKQHSQAVKDIKHFIKDIKKYFESLENKVTTDVGKIKDEDKKKMDFISATCTSLRNDLQSLTYDLAKLHQTQQNGKLFTKMEEARNQMKTIAKNIDCMNNENKMLKYTFVPEKQIEDLVRNVAVLGKLNIDVEPNPNGQTKILESSDEDDMTFYDASKTLTDIPTNTPTQTRSTPLHDTKQATAKQQYPYSRRQASKVSEITVKSSTDKETPLVTGIALLPDDQLVLADNCNNKVKLVNIKQNTIVTELKLSAFPWDITTVDNNLIAVTMPVANQIQLLSITKNFFFFPHSLFSEGQNISVKGRCHGILHNDGTLIVTYEKPANIEMLSMNGVVLKVIEKGLNSELLFINPEYIALSPDNTHVYISDYRKHTVTCMTLDGEVMGVYKDGSLRYPRGMTVDKTGSVYVTGGCKPNLHIHQIAGDCSQGQKLQRNRLEERSQSITYCHEEDKLYVGYDCINSIKVFQLK